jgi:ribA/ribD-fused uncharacterized protein
MEKLQESMGTSKRDNTELIKLCSSHNDQEIRGFFGEYRWLSNFHMCDVYYKGALYPSSEHAYMSAKSNRIADKKIFQKISGSGGEHIGPSAAQARKMGQNITLREDWEQVKSSVMLECLISKFTNNEDLKNKLLETENKYLEETNWWMDRFYGVDYKTGQGQNMLGRCLMKVRRFLQDEL